MSNVIGEDIIVSYILINEEARRFVARGSLINILGTLYLRIEPRLL